MQRVETYKPYNTTVIMGNDITCSVIGIGTVKIEMFDRVVRVFEDVRHTPDLIDNLISLGLLDDLDYFYLSKGGVMKITKGNLLVMKGRKVNQLYRLIGNTLVGGAAVITPTESSIDDTKLWHMRLSHIGQRGTLELHKRNLLKGVKTCKLDFCKYCVYRKQHRDSFKTSSHTSKGVLDYVHSHVWGQFQFLLTAVLTTSSISLMTNLGRFGFIFKSGILRYLAYLRNGKSKLKIRLIEK